ncbi:MAG: histidine phosphatase family protein [Demequinaceae bacterium]|nr:histidine phosphatase family protein [Demequinaceae bacterium]
MRVIVLARHAKAEEPSPRRPDHARALTVKGREDADVLGKSLSAIGFEPEVAYVSDAARTVETWVIASRGWEVSEVHRGREMYNTTVPTMIAALRATPLGASKVMVVGHEPTISSVAAYLAGKGSNKEAVQRVAQGLRTGSAALLEYDGEWEDLGLDAARLRAVVGRNGE